MESDHLLLFSNLIRLYQYHPVAYLKYWLRYGVKYNRLFKFKKKKIIYFPKISNYDFLNEHET